MYTQCPECSTFFQVTPEHLKIAQGNVRCGQCRNVFSALGNLTERPPNAGQAPANSLDADIDDIEIEEEQDSPIDFDDELFNLEPADKPEPQVEPADKPGPQVEPAAQAKPDAATKIRAGLSQAIEAIQALGKSSKGLHSLEEGKDSYLAQIQSVQNNTVPVSKPARQNKKKPARVTTKQPQTRNKPAPVSTKPTPAAVQKPKPPTKRKTAKPPKPTDIDFDEAFRAIDDLEINEAQKHRGQVEETVIVDEAARQPVEETKDDTVDIDVKVKPLERPKTPTSYNPAPITDRALAVIPKQLREDFQPSQQANAHHSPLAPIWGVGSIVLMLVFLVQTVYFKHDDLAQNQRLRPWIQSFCKHLACDVSLPIDIKKLELLGQDIHSHPKVKKALLVSTTIINNAPFRQAYPGLLITFSNLNGQKVAMRKFLPKEYLPSNVDLTKGMPSDTPVQIKLEVYDPGKNAVNFEFDFFPYPYKE